MDGVASSCWMMRPRGFAAGHADLASYAVKAVRKEQFQWVEWPMGINLKKDQMGVSG